MKGSAKQIAWANEIVNKMEKVALSSNGKAKFLLDTVVSCCKAEDTYAGDIIELFAQCVKESDDRIAPVAAKYMQNFQNALRDAIYAAATK